MKWLVACPAVIWLVIVSSPESPAVSAAEGRCATRSTGQTTAIIDGDLYAMVRSQRGRHLFGWSGPPVLDLPEAIRLLRGLGLKGTDAELARFLLNAPPIVGGDYFDDGDFSFKCPSTYRLTAVVRRDPSLPKGWFHPTRIWLHHERGSRVLRSFCVTPQLLPHGARISVTFKAPLASSPPRWEVDRNADGVIDRSGKFRPGGASFPSSARC